MMIDGADVSGMELCKIPSRTVPLEPNPRKLMRFKIGDFFLYVKQFEEDITSIIVCLSSSEAQFSHSATNHSRYATKTTAKSTLNAATLVGKTCAVLATMRGGRLDLHPCFAGTGEKTLIDDTVFNLRPKVSSRCKSCKRRKISDGDRDVPGWAYVSTCDKYNFHVFCMLEMVHEAWMKNGEMGLEKVELRQLVRFSRNRGSGRGAVFETMKSVLKIILAALLGDPTALISSAFVELVSRSLE
ncbi:hypothetical protein DH2020_036163 [Rehmannia glutinosa]|uniref:Uncharacterized protein n=1 Tax=Rehmannia glutinosa TaxID=99300 RepID=A0ABR0V7W0_REHGL